MLYYLIFFFLIFFSSLFPMEMIEQDLGSSSKHDNKICIVADKNGRWNFFPQDYVLKFKVLKDSYEQDSNKDTVKFDHENVALFELRENSFDTLDNFRLCIECLKNKQYIQEIPKEKLIQIFRLAHYYGASFNPVKFCEKFCEKLALRVFNCIPKSEMIPEIKNYIKSPCSLLESKFLDLNKRKYGLTLDLGKLGFNCLDGLEKLSDKTITTLNLSNNKLVSVDIDLIFKLFPNLQELNISDNPIEKLKMTIVSDNVTIKMQNVHLKDLDGFISGEKCLFDFSGNNFSRELKKKIKICAHKRPWIKHFAVMYRYFYPTGIIWTIFLGSVTIPVGTIAGYACGSIVDFFLQTKASDNSSDYKTMGTLIGGCVGAAFPLAYSTKEYWDCYKSNRLCKGPGLGGHNMCAEYIKSKVHF